MARKYKRLESLIGNNSDLMKGFRSITNNVEGIYIIKEIANFLEDGNPLLNHITDNNKKALASLAVRYYMACVDVTLTHNKAEKLVESARQEIYTILAPEGLRVATIYEVENGSLGLIAEESYPLGEEKYKLLNLMLWANTGRLRYYSKAGYSYNYESGVGLADNIYEMVDRASDSLIKLLEWAENREEFNRDINKIKTLSRKKYKYPEYAADEVKADITIKQLVFYLDRNLPRGSKDERVREALHLIIRSKKDRRFKMSPVEISFLREVYQDLRSGVIEESTDDEEVDEEKKPLQVECERLKEGRDKGLIDGGHFAFKIINTLEKYNYNKCSQKQYEIIRDALNKLNTEEQLREQQQKEEATPIIDDVDALIDGDILDISNALGGGKLTVDD